MPNTVGDRLARMLALLPYLAQADGPLPVRAVAQHFGVSEAQLREDLRALWMVGTPGMGYDDMLQFGNYEYDDPYVDLRDARGLTQPLRLTFFEGVALTAALRGLRQALENQPELLAVVNSTLDKLAVATASFDSDTAARRSTAVGKPTAVVDDSTVLDVRLPQPGDPEVVQAVLTALTDKQMLLLEYVDAADRTSRRVVTPERIEMANGAAYLVAWCHSANGERTFRMDRILNAAAGSFASLLGADELPAPRGPGGRSRAPARRRSQAPRGQEVTLHLAPSALWLAEELDAGQIDVQDDGSLLVTFRMHDRAWLERLLLAQARGVLDAPAEVAAAVAAEANSALANYGAALANQPDAPTDAPAPSHGSAANAAP